MSLLWCQLAWLGGETVDAGVQLTVEEGTIIDVASGVIMPPPDATTLTGLVVPGFVNAHSHVFHRALRARTHGDADTFWSWRDAMYDVAASLDPDSLYRLARATYAEMAMAGMTAVGEFHYLHHQPDGTPYGRQTTMTDALTAAASDAGIRLTIIDTCYLRGGHDEELSPIQRRFTDGSAAGWVDRVEGNRRTDMVRFGAAIHSVRAVPLDEMEPVVSWALRHAAPLHAHVSEQPAENAAAHTEHGMSPTHALARAGALETSFTAVHATHVDDADVELLANHDAMACICPTTERELADGIGPTARLAAAGVGLCLGSDSQAVIDMAEEMRAVELNQRLVTGRRGHHPPHELLEMATAGGAAAIGWPELGRIAPGAPADLLAISLDSVRTAGSAADNAIDAAVFAATAADIHTVIVAGTPIVTGGRHTRIDAAAELRDALEML